ncbi:MAG: phosphoribosylamine--glycine ligase [Patescibacteria group bacterium]
MSKENTVLVVGNGGREQAFAWKSALSFQVGQVYVAPGNPGSESLARSTGKLISNIDLPQDQIGAIVDFTRKTRVDMVIVGPEGLLAEGIGDVLLEEGIPAVAPTSATALLETDKAHTRLLCRDLGIRQPEFAVFADGEEAIYYIDHKFPAEEGVVKVSGLAGGKGVAVCDTKEAMRQAVREAKGRFGAAADKIIIEQRLHGTEASFIAFVDGEHILPLIPAMDHKRLLAGDRGPNTGGMGVIAPNPVVTPEIAQIISSQIMQPVIDKLADQGNPYKGILYAGVMLVGGEPYLLEFNARGGDPETQAQMPLLNMDLYGILQATVKGRLDQLTPRYHNEACAVVILAAEGYPDNPRKGKVIYGLDKVNDPDVIVFQAGTRRIENELVTAGGRVLGVTARGSTIKLALQKAYANIYNDRIYFDGMQYRTDIGKSV